ncbi:hypothetical protein [Clostridium grantii]|uniref:hypothetical protein n=1 Tax=Clostridium grantii TaxID=40575 RepID=UPI000933EB53|nr:hypothetical protein [Clostridium grantii]
MSYNNSYGSTFLKFYNLATSVQFQQEKQTSNVLTFYDRIVEVVCTSEVQIFPSTRLQEEYIKNHLYS